MSTLHVRNIPPELYERLRRRAERQHRSMSAEVIDIIEHMTQFEKRRAQQLELLQRMDAFREHFKPAALGLSSSVELLREGREK